MREGAQTTSGSLPQGSRREVCHQWPRWSLVVVDDDPGITEVIDTCFRRNGFDVAPVQTVADALRAIAELHPDLVLTDIEMPDGGARMLLSALSDQGVRPRIVLMSAGKGEWAREMLDRGYARAFLRKPFSLNRMIELLARIMSDADEAKRM